ncbi:hypothetical protein GQ457_12G031920 [Hibiscus cannabinus]
MGQIGVAFPRLQPIDPSPFTVGWLRFHDISGELRKVGCSMGGVGVTGKFWLEAWSVVIMVEAQVLVREEDGGCGRFCGGDHGSSEEVRGVPKGTVGAGRAHEKLFGVWTKSVHQHKIGVEIKAIQTKLENISKTLPAYEIPGGGAESSSVSSMQQQLRRTFSHVEEEDVVSTKDVLAQLMTEEDRSHAVVSIVGMGGIGKTTLARQVYNHVDVKRRFDCLAWVSISQQCNPGEVLLGVLMKVLSPSKDERELIEKEE